MLSWILVLISIPFLMLGAHGLYAYFHPLETLFSSNPDRLFFAISVPTQVSGLVNWMSLKGFQSFFVPAVFVACGIGLIWWARNRGFHFSLPRWRMANKHQSKNKFGNYQSKTKSGSHHIIFKTILSLSVIVGSVILVWFGYRLFTYETSPLSGSITFLVGLGTIVGLIWLLRKKYIWYQPSFGMVTLVIVIIAVVFAFAGVKPFQAYKDNLIDVFSGKSNTLSATNPAQQITRFSTASVIWEVILKSVKWNGARINTEIVATNMGKTPADFPYEDVDPIGAVVDFAVIDAYGLWYGPDNIQNYNVCKIYPGESRNFRPSFTVNLKSGDVTLYVTRYTGTSNFPLFKLKSPN